MITQLFDIGLPILAGPCSAETEEQTLATARALAAAGVGMFRAGVWKPRTKPGGFEGAGAPALKWLRRVKEETGMLTATEIAVPAHLEQVLEAGIDAVWIGARTTTNPFAVQELADAFAALTPEERGRLAVLVKNPVNPDIELWIGALQRLAAAGITRLGAIHRGFSSYGEKYYRNAPMWRIPIELRRRMPELPVICDPSHIAGRREIVPSVARQAMDMKFDGLIIESHIHPEAALSDGAQQLTPAELEELVAILKPGASKAAAPRPEAAGISPLDELRERIDDIDDKLMALLAGRMAVAREIGKFKRNNGMTVVQPDRYRALIERRAAAAADLGLSPEFIKTILAAIHEESVRQQL